MQIRGRSAHMEALRRVATRSRRQAVAPADGEPSKPKEALVHQTESMRKQEEPPQDLAGKGRQGARRAEARPPRIGRVP